MRAITLIFIVTVASCGEVPWPGESGSASSTPVLGPSAFAQKYSIPFQAASQSGAVCVNLSNANVPTISARLEDEARAQASNNPAAWEWFQKLQTSPTQATAQEYLRYVQNQGHSVIIAGRIGTSGCGGGVDPFTGYIQSVHGAFTEIAMGR